MAAFHRKGLALCGIEVNKSDSCGSPDCAGSVLPGDGLFASAAVVHVSYPDRSSRRHQHEIIVRPQARERIAVLVGRKSTIGYAAPRNFQCPRIYELAVPADARGATQENARRVARNIRCAVLLSFLSGPFRRSADWTETSTRRCNSTANLDRREEIIVTYVGGC